MSLTEQSVDDRPLSRQVILEAAISLIENEGIDQFSIRKLGALLNRNPTAFYRHYRSKSDLLLAVADQLLSEILVDFVPDDDWAQSLRDIVHRARSVYLRHPELSETLAFAPDGLSGNARVYEQVLRALVRSGLPDDDVPRFADVLARWTINLSYYDARPGAFGPGSRSTSDDFLMSRQIFATLPVDEFEYCVRYAPHLFPEGDKAFDSGLELILSAVHNRVAAGAAAPARTEGPRPLGPESSRHRSG